MNNMIPLFQVAMSPRAKDMLAEILTPNPDGSFYIGEGPLCAKLEIELAKTLAYPHILLVNSGTSALKLALHLAGARPGAEVISTPQTCLFTNTAIIETGARIVWADVDPVTGNIDPNDVLRRVSSRTVAIMAVDWAGRVCDFGSLRKYTRGLSLIEDAAHAFGAAAAQRGDFICHSFQAIKHFTTADGGGLVCPGTALHERGRLLRWAGLDRTRSDSMRCYQSVAEAGFKMQSNDVAAAIGLANLPDAMQRVNLSRANARAFSARLAAIPHIKTGPPDDGASWWFYPIRVSNPIRFEAHMTEQGIAVGQVHARNDINPCFDRALGGPLPGVDEFSAHQTNLPCGWFIDQARQDRIVQAVEKWSATDDARW
ncbi:MAG: DegT/DnrJ/EryC1/StrS aminotransferase family protein [Betaproteobacteria bacterium]|nr:DegT/DnrJ/EryC1/StrS aminotransferase family protein [Betaproteobacteria bacterium]